MVFGPSCSMLSRSDESNPRISDVMPTIEVMPMTTPRMVSAERSLLVRTVSSAMRTTSPSSPLLTSQRLNRIERGRPGGGVGAKEQPDRRGNADTKHDGPHLEDRRERRDRRDAHGKDEPEENTDHAAEGRERDRLGQHLRHDVAALRAE